MRVRRVRRLTKQSANPDNTKPERQLDEVGRKTAIAMGKASAI